MKSGIRSIGLSAYATTQTASAFTYHGVSGCLQQNQRTITSRFRLRAQFRRLSITCRIGILKVIRSRLSYGYLDFIEILIEREQKQQNLYATSSSLTASGRFLPDAATGCDCLSRPTGLDRRRTIRLVNKSLLFCN